MLLFFFKSINPEQLKVYFILEVVLIIINYFLFIGIVVFIAKVRIHINLKVISIGIVLHYFPCLTARLIIIAYETGVLSLEKRIAHNNLIVFCSWFRCYDFGLILSILFCVAVEREFAMQFITDYERHKRLWIPALILAIDLPFCTLFASAYTFEWMPWYPIAILGVIGTIFGVILFFHSLHNARLFLNLITKHNGYSHKYNLSLRFQLEENLWCGKLMKNAIVSLSLINVSTFTIFAGANSHLVREKYGEDFTQLLDCLYNILIVIYGPILALAGVFHNTYLIGVVKSLFPFIFNLEKEEDLEPGHVYFIQLQELWEKPLSEKEKKYQQRKNKLSSRFSRIEAL